MGLIERKTGRRIKSGERHHIKSDTRPPAIFPRQYGRTENMRRVLNAAYLSEVEKRWTALQEGTDTMTAPCFVPADDSPYTQNPEGEETMIPMPKIKPAMSETIKTTLQEKREKLGRIAQQNRQEASTFYQEAEESTKAAERFEAEAESIRQFLLSHE